MSPRVRLFGSRSRLLTIGSTFAILALVLVVGTVTVLAFRSARAGGTGSGCVPTGPGPACTFKNVTAYVDFSSVSSDGCIYTDAQVSLFDSLTTPGRTALQSVTIFISKWDGCNQVSLLSASNFDPNTFQPTFTGTIHLSSDLSTATVNGTAAMYDWNTGTQSFTTTVNLTFKGYGPISTIRDMQHFQAPGFTMNTHDTGTNRSAEVSGTFTDDTGSNIAALPTTYASVGNSKGGTVEFFRG
jgi:hypothetical protein